MLLMKITPIKKMRYNFNRSNLKIILHFYNLKSVKAFREVLMKILQTYNITKTNNQTTLNYYLINKITINKTKIY